jgi:hypothetical protein
MASNRIAEERCEHYMSEHHGVIHRATALSLGMPAHAVHRRVRTGVWERVFDDVLKRRASPLTWEGTALAGCLQGGDGFVIAGGAALRLLGFPEYRDAPAEIAGPTHANVSGIVCHRYRDMIPEDAVEVRGLPCRRFEPTLLELCGGAEGYKAGPLLDEALRRKLTCLAWLYRTLHRYGKRGRAGTVRFRSLLAQRDDTLALTDSELEVIFLRGGSRLTRKPVMHHVVHVGDKTLEIDFAYPSLKIAIELDGFDEHGKHVGFESDRARDVILQNDGWIVLRFTWFQLVHDRDWVFEQINKAVANRS